jgi:hypothetical protein
VERAERFARGWALATEIPPPRPPFGTMLRFAIALALFAYGIVWVLRHLHVPDVIVEMAGWLVLWLGVMGLASGRAWRQLSGAFMRKVVLIVEKRMTQDATIVMRFLIVEDERGVRVEHLVSARVYDAATVGAIGVLFTKRDVAWGFHAVD